MRGKGGEGNGRGNEEEGKWGEIMQFL